SSDVCSSDLSQSTYLRGGLGGFQGRALRKGDVLKLKASLPNHALDALANDLADTYIYLPSTLVNNPRERLRVVRGPHTRLFNEAAIESLLNSDYRISNQSDRMGYRLEGPALPLRENQQLLSEGATFGSIQVPADGAPIVLMADRQSIGGYPKIAHVITVDLPQLAQSMPGDTIRFEEVELPVAYQLDMQRERALMDLKDALTPIRERIWDVTGHMSGGSVAV